MNKPTLYICIAAVLAVLAFAVAPPLPADAAPCPAGTDPYAEYRLFFGRSEGGTEVVTDAAWSAFLASEVTPRFPDGLTVLDAAGQWRDASGKIAGERTKLLLILVEPGPDGAQRIEEIADAYKRRFGQESVLRAVTTACASF